MEFPLWRLKPEDAARIIILLPQTRVEHHKHWHKRIPRIHPSKRSAPRMDDERTLDRAKWHSYWEAYHEDQLEAFPIVGVLKGPFLRNGQFWSQVDRVANPLGFERQREPFEGLYSRDAYEHDVEYLEQARALNRENFILGQQGEGPYVDGLIYMRVDNLLQAEIAHCAARLRTTSAILQARRLAKLKAQSKDNEHWQPIGTDEATAFQFKHSGYTIRKVGLRNYEVLIG